MTGRQRAPFIDEVASFLEDLFKSRQASRHLRADTNQLTRRSGSILSIKILDVETLSDSLDFLHRLKSLCYHHTTTSFFLQSHPSPNIGSHILRTATHLGFSLASFVKLLANRRLRISTCRTGQILFPSREQALARLPRYSVESLDNLCKRWWPTTLPLMIPRL